MELYLCPLPLVCFHGAERGKFAFMWIFIVMESLGYEDKWSGTLLPTTRLQWEFFMFAPCINSIKALFINPTDAHKYKITGMLKTIKIPTIAPTCFGSPRNHHQGAISCLAKTTIMVLLCSSLMTWSMSWRHISLCASVRCTARLLPGDGSWVNRNMS